LWVGQRRDMVVKPGQIHSWNLPRGIYTSPELVHCRRYFKNTKLNSRKAISTYQQVEDRNSTIINIFGQQRDGDKCSLSYGIDNGTNYLVEAGKLMSVEELIAIPFPSSPHRERERENGEVALRWSEASIRAWALHFSSQQKTGNSCEYLRTSPYNSSHRKWSTRCLKPNP